MKNIVVVLFTIFAFYSCEHLETNSPVFQGEVDNIFFKALDAQIIENEDGSYTIQGISLEETVSIRISSTQNGTYTLGGESVNFATYEDNDGNIYTSNPEGEGTVVVTSQDTLVNALTGTFNFVGILSGVDTLAISNGIFFEIPYITSGDAVVGTFSTDIDGTPFIPFTISAADTGNSIIIIGSAKF